MALSLLGVVADVGTTHAIQTSATSTADVLKAGAGKIYKVEIDNSANGGAVYLKLFDTTGDVTAGSTAPDFSFKCPGSSVKVFSCPQGHAFATGLKAICVTNGGGTAGNTNPGSAVIYRILFGS